MMCASAKPETRNMAGGVDEVVASAGGLDAALTTEGHDVNVNNDNNTPEAHHVLEQIHAGEEGGEGEREEIGNVANVANVLGVVPNDVPVSVSATVDAGSTISVAPASSLIAQAVSSGPSIPSGDNNILVTQPMLDLSRQTLVLHESVDNVMGVAQPVNNAVPKRKRRQYASEEERRTARILKNRRTAEESRQRRLKKMKDLEEYAKNAAAREQKLLEEITGLRQTVTAQAQLIESMRSMQAQDMEQRNLDMKRVKLRK